MKHVMKKLALTFAWLALVAGANVQAATELVVNGDFENYDQGWTIPEDFTALIGFSGPNFGAAHSGFQNVQFVANGTFATVSQSLATTNFVAETYSLSFWLASDLGAPNDFEVIWGGSKVFAQTNRSDTDWMQYTVSGLLASSVNTVLEFRGLANATNGALYLDDVSVLASVTAVPEPATYAMLLAGLGMLGVMARRRTRI